MTKETKDLGAAPPRSTIATTVQIVPTEEQLATWMLCNVLGKQTDPDWIPPRLLWEPIVLALRQYAAEAIATSVNAAPSMISELRSARAWRKRVRAAMLDCARDIEKEYPAWARDWREMAGNGNAAQPPPDSSAAALLEARRLLEEAYSFTDALAAGRAWNFDVTKLRNSLRAFLRSDSERSEPARSESGGSKVVHDPSEEER